MAYGHINQDGDFVNDDETETATKCDVCEKIQTEENSINLYDRFEHVSAEVLGLNDLTGMADVCGKCIVDGIGKKGKKKLKKEVFEESEGFENI